MAVEVIKVAVSTRGDATVSGGSTFEQNLTTQINTAISGLGGSWDVVHVERRDGGREKEVYLVWLQS